MIAGLSILFIVFIWQRCAAQLCSEPWEKHRYKHGQTVVPCHTFRDGTCLIVSNNEVDISVAQMECTYKYGGQLVIPKNKEEILTIVKKIHFYPGLKINEGQSNLFWIGLYANTDDDDMRLDVKMYWHTLHEPSWLRHMMLPDDPRIERIDFPIKNMLGIKTSEAIYMPFDVGVCADTSYTLDILDGTFVIDEGRSKHRYLCETPRLPKIKCPDGYFLDRKENMCYKGFPGNFHMFTARKFCREHKSIIGISSIYAVEGIGQFGFLNYLMNIDDTVPGGSYFVGSVVRNGVIAVNDDGSKHQHSNCRIGNARGHITIEKTKDKTEKPKKGTFCAPHYLTDQYGVICSVRPDQSKAQY